MTPPAFCYAFAALTFVAAVLNLPFALDGSTPNGIAIIIASTSAGFIAALGKENR